MNYQKEVIWNRKLVSYESVFAVNLIKLIVH